MMVDEGARFLADNFLHATARPLDGDTLDSLRLWNSEVNRELGLRGISRSALHLAHLLAFPILNSDSRSDGIERRSEHALSDFYSQIRPADEQQPQKTWR